MQRISATSRKSVVSQRVTSLWPELPVNHSLCRDAAKAWMMLVANSPFSSPSCLAQVVHDGSSGKMFPECCELTEDETSGRSSRAWGNAGMGSPTEFWTLDISEAPQDADVCLLSDILQTGSVPPQCYLTEHNIERMRLRLRKYVKESSPLLTALNQCSAGPVTKRRSMG